MVVTILGALLVLMFVRLPASLIHHRGRGGSRRADWRDHHRRVHALIRARIEQRQGPCRA
jgi:hypothetical protein